MPRFLADSCLFRPSSGLQRWGFFHALGEGSAHAVFSPTDASRLVERGWAERY